MKEYYYLNGKEQLGPFTADQLTEKRLTSETLVWTEGMDNWEKLNEVSELFQLIKPKATPPPVPFEIDEKTSKTEVSGEIKVVKEKLPNPTIEAITPSNSNLIWILLWCGFHFFALLTSYSEIEIFNDAGKPQTEKFWPFVEYQHCRAHINWWNSSRTYGTVSGEDCEFRGMFADYDWSEFLVYVGGVFLMFILMKIPKDNESPQLSNAGDRSVTEKRESSE